MVIFTIRIKEMYKSYDSPISFDIDGIDTEQYDAVKYVKDGLTTAAVVRESDVNYIVARDELLKGSDIMNGTVEI